MLLLTLRICDCDIQWHHLFSPRSRHTEVVGAEDDQLEVYVHVIIYHDTLSISPCSIFSV